METSTVDKAVLNTDSTWRSVVSTEAKRLSIMSNSSDSRKQMSVEERCRMLANEQSSRRSSTSSAGSRRSLIHEKHPTRRSLLCDDKRRSLITEDRRRSLHSLDGSVGKLNSRRSSTIKQNSKRGLNSVDEVKERKSFITEGIGRNLLQEVRGTEDRDRRQTFVAGSSRGNRAIINPEDRKRLLAQQRRAGQCKSASSIETQEQLIRKFASNFKSETRLKSNVVEFEEFESKAERKLSSSTESTCGTNYSNDSKTSMDIPAHVNRKKRGSAANRESFIRSIDKALSLTSIFDDLKKEAKEQQSLDDHDPDKEHAHEMTLLVS